jgi:hypothetical protein
MCTIFVIPLYIYEDLREFRNSELHLHTHLHCVVYGGQYIIIRYN